MNAIKVLAWILMINMTAGVSLRHGHSHAKSTVKRHQRRELELGVRYSNLPYLSYDTQNNSIIVAQVGGSALLKCYTENLGDELVTWLKSDDEQLLTAGPQVYSSEDRYSVSHIKHQKLWELKIRNVQTTDAGSYECQLTTHPPISILMNLKVVEARGMILGRKELHVHEGSRLRLVCRVEEATEPPMFVFWFHNGSMVNYEANRPLSVTNQKFGSTLTISHVSRTDAGAYRCEPSNAKPDNITLHVVADENSAAMQRGVDKNPREPNSSTTTALATQSGASVLTDHISVPLVLIFLIIQPLMQGLTDISYFNIFVNLFANHISVTHFIKKYLLLGLSVPFCSIVGVFNKFFHVICSNTKIIFYLSSILSACTVNLIKIVMRFLYSCCVQVNVNACLPFKENKSGS